MCRKVLVYSMGEEGVGGLTIGVLALCVSLLGQRSLGVPPVEALLGGLAPADCSGHLLRAGH